MENDFQEETLPTNNRSVFQNDPPTGRFPGKIRGYGGSILLSGTRDRAVPGEGVVLVSGTQDDTGVDHKQY
jgi:hypothetical protein